MVVYIDIFQVMMLIKTSLPSSIAAVSDHGQQEFSCIWIPHDLTWQEPIPVSKHRNKDDNSCSHNFLNSSLPSTNINMSETYTPNFVYKRRKIQRNSSSVLPLSQNSMPTFVYKRRKVQKKPSAAFTAQVSTNTRASDSCFSAYSPEAVDGASLQHEPMSEDDPKIKIRKVLDLYAVNDNYSSSKSNKDLDSASMKLQVDDVGECSSSGALIMEGFEKDISKKNACISFLRHHGVLERSLRIKTRSQKLVSVRRSCKVCMQSETTLNMLICDLCEESFHVFCCNPSKVCTGEWFCDSCLRKKLKKLKAINSRKLTKDSGPIASMLRDADSYTSNVRIGKDFQAEVPDWSDPVINDHNDYGEHAEISPLECSGYQDWSSNKLLRLSSIGNWLQCREVIDGDGTICGKWRRAPLFEVQTDAWECFRSVLWDPAHADCAVPQELDTDQVLKHLKYIEMLRPRLAAKRCKLGVNKGVDSK